MISKIICISSLLVALAASDCVWDSSICTKVLETDINVELQKYSDIFGRTEGETGPLEEVLAIDLQCLQDACQLEDETAKADGVEQCRSNTKLTVENQLQFVPSNFKEQLQRVCTCGYGDLTNQVAGDVSISSDEVESIYNCDANLPSSQYCHNAPVLTLDHGVCDETNAQDFIDEMKEKTREAMEMIRIGTFCKGEVEAMVRGDDLLTPTCQQEVDLRNTLTNKCDSKCFHNPQYVAINDAEIDPGFFVDYYSWYVDCNDGLDNVRDTSGKSAAVKMTEVCWEYLSTGEIPVQLRYPMFTSSLHTDDEIKDALDEACLLDVTEYTQVNYDDLQSDLGKVELKKVSEKGLALDYGFSSSMRRAVLTKVTGNCWDKKNLNYSHCSQDYFSDDCEDGMEKMDICESASLENFNWFLKYLDDDSTKVALEACDEGAYFGKHILTLPGMSTTLAAEKFARYQESGTRMTAFLVFHDCAVAAAMKANNYFADGSCNANAMDVQTII